MHVAVVVQEEMQCSFEASCGAVRDVKHGQTCVSFPCPPHLWTEVRAKRRRHRRGIAHLYYFPLISKSPAPQQACFSARLPRPSSFVLPLLDSSLTGERARGAAFGREEPVKRSLALPLRQE